MKIALASPPFPNSIEDGLHWLEKLAREAKQQEAELICFPESYIPGYPLLEFKPELRSPEKLINALEKACRIAATLSIALILPMDWYGKHGLLNLVQVISKEGKVLGNQTKNQLDPSEDELWTPGNQRTLFEINKLKFGITICHEGFRYPESVRWAARSGAQVVFHPQCTGSNIRGRALSEWGAKENPYYEKAIMMRAMENTIYFASSNYCFRYPESASSLIDPQGQCIAYVPYQKVGIVVEEIDPEQATGLLAKRFRSETYS